MHSILLRVSFVVFDVAGSWGESAVLAKSRKEADGYCRCARALGFDPIVNKVDPPLYDYHYFANGDRFFRYQTKEEILDDLEVPEEIFCTDNYYTDARDLFDGKIDRAVIEETAIITKVL